MIKGRQRRRRDVLVPDKAVPMVNPPVPPSGPAGGDLGGTYPGPTVVSLANVAAGGSLSGMMDVPTVNSINGIAASGDLRGSFPAPVVTSPSNPPPVLLTRDCLLIGLHFNADRHAWLT